MAIDLKGFSLSRAQNRLLGIAVMAIVIHGILKVQDVETALDKWFIPFRMLNAAIGLGCLLFSGWEGWKSKNEVKEFVKKKIERVKDNET